MKVNMTKTTRIQLFDKIKLTVLLFSTVYPSLPLHKVFTPLHVPFAWHLRIDEPLRINPGSHSNCTLLGKTVRLPDKEPFLGGSSSPQSTAATEKYCQ